MKKRVNIDTIAEILIDKLEEVNKLTAKLEIVSQKSIKIDANQMLDERQNLEKTFKAFLSDYKIIEEELREEQKKASKSLSEWRLYIVLILASAIILAGVGVYGISQLKRANEIESVAYEKGIIQGIKEGRTQILNSVTKSCKAYLEKKFPDNEKVFWNHK